MLKITVAITVAFAIFMGYMTGSAFYSIADKINQVAKGVQK